MALTNTFRNPILPGFNPDPSFVHVPGQGYFLCTSTFEFWPGLPIYHSTDLTSWRLIGHAINDRKQGIDMRTVEASGGLWAPTIRYHKGKFYVSCGVMYRFRLPPDNHGHVDVITPRGFYVSTSDIFASAWSDPIYFDELGIDQDLFFDTDDRVYLSVSRGITEPEIPRVSFHHGVYANEIDLATGRSISPAVLLRHSPTGTAEGSHIFKHEEWYYLLSAEGGTESGHREDIFRSKNPLGPYTAPPEGINPLVHNGRHPDVQNTGHMDVTLGPSGDWWAVFLGVRPQRNDLVDSDPAKDAVAMPSQLGRETFLAALEWRDGWPVVNGGKQIELKAEGKGLMFVEEEKKWRDDFDGDALKLGWYTVQTPLKPFHTISPSTHLRLFGSPYRLSSGESPSMLLQKQIAFSLDWTTRLSFEPTFPGQEAGTVAWLGPKSFAVIGVRGSLKRDGSKEIVYSAPGEDGKGFEEKTVPYPASSSSINLLIRARPKSYEFAYAIDSTPTEFITLGSVTSKALKPLFTGAHLGVYAMGAEGRPCLNSATFEFVQWERV